MHYKIHDIHAYIKIWVTQPLKQFMNDLVYS